MSQIVSQPYFFENSKFSSFLPYCHDRQPNSSNSDVQSINNSNTSLNSLPIPLPRQSKLFRDRSVETFQSYRRNPSPHPPPSSPEPISQYFQHENNSDYALAQYLKTQQLEKINQDQEFKRLQQKRLSKYLADIQPQYQMQQNQGTIQQILLEQKKQYEQYSFQQQQSQPHLTYEEQKNEYNTNYNQREAILQPIQIVEERGPSNNNLQQKKHNNISTNMIIHIKHKEYLQRQLQEEGDNIAQRSSNSNVISSLGSSDQIAPSIEWLIEKRISKQHEKQKEQYYESRVQSQNQTSLINSPNRRVDSSHFNQALNVKSQSRLLLLDQFAKNVISQDYIRVHSNDFSTQVANPIKISNAEPVSKVNEAASQINFRIVNPLEKGLAVPRQVSLIYPTARSQTELLIEQRDIRSKLQNQYERKKEQLAILSQSIQLLINDYVNFEQSLRAQEQQTCKQRKQFPISVSSAANVTTAEPETEQAAATLSRNSETKYLLSSQDQCFFL